MKKIRKPKQNEIDYVEENLAILRKSIDQARSYIDSNPWIDLPEDQKAKELKFQSDLVDKIVDWNAQFMRLSGIMDIFEKVNSANKRNKAGQNTSGIEMILENKMI